MALKPGTRLGQYEVLAHIGSGGMGEVYRARDTKLNREVAVKVLPEHFARDPERILRFRREAQTLAQLNHPKIALLYNFEETATERFLVMEYVPGDTLRERIQRGSREWGVGSGGRQEVKESEELQDDPQIAQITPKEKVQVPRRFPRLRSGQAAPRDDTRGKGGAGSGIAVAEALDICKQIAEALEHAHEKGIVHRDLKPANVKITPQGQLKVLDFGLAKAFAKAGQPVDPPVDPMDIPTGSLQGTLAGTVLGTPAYMSPEQASGKEVDKRADIWALGVVLFELLSGRHAFEGETITEIIASVLKSEPEWSALPAETPPGVRSLLKRCLRKDLAGRFHDAADVRIAIEEALSAPEWVQASRPVQQEQRQARMPVLLAGAAALALGLVVGGAAVWNLRPMPETISSPPTRLEVSLPPGERLQSVLGLPDVALSPDGTSLAYVSSRGGNRQLYLRRMDSFEVKPLPGTDGAKNPFFSPDGQWIGFAAEGKLMKIAVSGGAPLTISDAPNQLLGASWGTNDIIVFPATNLAGLVKVSASGGKPEILTSLDKTAGEISHRWPQLLPDGKSVIFLAASNPNWDESPIVLQRLDTGERKVLIQAGTYPRYVPTGHLAYMRGNTLMAVPFDLGRLEVTGTPVAVVEGVRLTNEGGGQFYFSQRGSLAYVAGDIAGAGGTLVWVDRKGGVQPLAAPPRGYDIPRLSPEGSRVAVTINQPTQVWIYDIPSGRLTRLAFEGLANQFAIWTPDGKRVTYRSTRAGYRNLFWSLADGSSGEERLTTSEHQQTPLSWSPDGKVLAYIDIDPTTGTDIWVLPLEGDPRQAGTEGRKPRPFLQTRFSENGPAFSPDGRWLAYSSNESGRDEIYVQPFPGPGGKWQVSTEGGSEVVWNRNGREVFYRSGDKMMAVDITTQPDFRVGSPRLLFEGQYAGRTNFPSYDVSPDGQRFLMIKPGAQEAGATQINVVLNWFEELKRRVPAGR